MQLYGLSNLQGVYDADGIEDSQIHLLLIVFRLVTTQAVIARRIFYAEAISVWAGGDCFAPLAMTFTCFEDNCLSSYSDSLYDTRFIYPNNAPHSILVPIKKYGRLVWRKAGFCFPHLQKGRNIPRP